MFFESSGRCSQGTLSSNPLTGKANPGSVQVAGKRLEILFLSGLESSPLNIYRTDRSLGTFQSKLIVR